MKMDDIAKLAGVSKASVSRVLNNKPNVSDALRAKVEKVIKEKNYTPNLLAQALNTKSTQFIGVLLPTIGLDVFSDITDGINQALSGMGYELLLVDSKGDLEKSINYLEVFQKKQMDGIIYFPTHMPTEHVDYLNGLTIPLVVVGMNDERLTVPSVSFADESAALDVVKHLVQYGHKKILYISMPQNHLIGNMRLNGYRTGMTNQGLEPEIVYAENLSYEAGYNAVNKIDYKKYTTIFAAMDRLVIGAMRSILDQDSKHFEKCSFVGIDDMEISKMLNPSLATVYFDYVKSGKLAGEMILDLIQMNKVDSIQLTYKFMKRSSLREV